MSVLAHVVLGGPQQAEPAATQALTYILNRDNDIAKAFIGMLGGGPMEFELGHIQAEVSSEGSRPDLTIHDTDGHVRIFVENKFWAPLTEAQPVSYLDSLPENPESALVFVVPEKRVATVWQILKERCETAGMEWEGIEENAPVKRVRVGGKNLMITNWQHTLGKLLDAAHPGNDGTRHDLLQLQGLVDREVLEGFLPLCDEDVTDQDSARRLVNFIGLIGSIVEKLTQDRNADTVSRNASSSTYYSGQYFCMYDRFELFLAIDLTLWRDHGVSPLWLGSWFKENRENMESLEEARGAFPNNVKSGDYRYFPIRLKCSAERDRVIDDAAEQIKRIVDHCRGPAPQDSPSGN